MQVLRLAAWRLQLFPVTMGRGPRFVDPGYFSVLHKLRFERLETSMLYSFDTCHPDLAPGRSSPVLRLY